MRSRRRRSLPLALALTLLLGAPLAHAVQIKHITAPRSVFLGAANIIARAQVAVAQKLYRDMRRTRTTLVLTMEEHRGDGSIINLGTWTERLVDLRLITLDGPNGRALVEFDTFTDDVASSSLIVACVEAIEHKMNGDRSLGVECRTLTPIP